MNYILGDKKPTAEEIEKQVPTEWMSDKSPPASYYESIDKLKHDNLCGELTKEILTTSKDKVPPKIRELAKKLSPLLPKIDRFWGDVMLGGKKSKKNRKKSKKNRKKSKKNRKKSKKNRKKSKKNRKKSKRRR